MVNLYQDALEILLVPSEQYTTDLTDLLDENTRKVSPCFTKDAAAK